MDQEQLKSLADTAFDRAVHRKNIKESVQAKLLVAFGGGLFLASPELISFLNSWTDETVYVEDTYGNPICVNRVELLEQTKATYTSAMTEWHSAFQNSNRIRRAQNV